MLLSEKNKTDKHASKPFKKRVPFSERPALDLLYFIFFASHLVASLLIDLQPLYPKQYVPEPLQQLLEYYIVLSNDPLVGGMYGMKDSSNLLWFKIFIYLEAFFQVPVFIIGLAHLYNGCKAIWPLLLIYATSSATTTLPCIFYLLSLPAPNAQTTIWEHTLTFEQRLLTLSGYIPFFLVPLIMVFDYGSRLTKLFSTTKAKKE